MPLIKPIKALIFDWGDTVMRDFSFTGPMSRWDRVEWIPGAEKALDHLSEKYLCIIATSADHSDTGEMINALKRVGAHSYFRHFFSSKELGHQKPDPRFFIRIAEKLGLDTAFCVMIGNAYEKDITGAKAAGMQTVFFNEHSDTGNFRSADAIINNMTELIDLIP